MRAALAALALGLVLVATGCGSSTAATGTSSGTDAASLVPASALAYVSADANLDSQSWQVVTDLFGPLDSKLDYKRDIQPAPGDRANLAVLGVDNGKPEAVAIVKPTDVAKLEALAKKFDQGTEHYTVEQIGGWSVVADSAEAFRAVRDAAAGNSLADNAEFKSAISQVGDSGFVTAYASGSGALGRCRHHRRQARATRRRTCRRRVDTHGVQTGTASRRTFGRDSRGLV